MFVRPKDRLRGLSGRCAAPLLTVLVVLVALGHLVGVAEGLGSTPVEQVAGSTQADILVTMSVLVLSPVWLAVFAWVASFPERLVLVILVVLAAYVGAGAVGLWALRCVGRELGTLGTMVGRVLPV